MSGLNKAFNRWWNDDPLFKDNPFNEDTPAYWAWEGWQAALKNSVMTDEEYEQAMADEGQRRMLTFDTEVREMIKEAVEMEREACAKVCESVDDFCKELNGMIDIAESCAATIRARGQE
tara:strand:- start:1102 stop:1458 length:357 start_codon:yes stop_codon:yes gene_type:complete